MYPITFPLRLGDRGPEVVNLQDGLLFLLQQQWFQLNPEERKKIDSLLRQEQQRQFFSDNATYELVQRFQERVGLQPQDEGVDRRTAEALNKVLENLGAFSNRGDEVLPQISRQLDGIANSANQLGTISDRLAQHGNQFGRMAADLTSQTNQLSSIDVQLGKQTNVLGNIDAKIGALDGGSAGKNLTLGDLGNDVEALQTDLMRLDLTIPNNELNGSVFGVGTRDAVIQLQTQFGLKTTGNLDSKTKSALARAVATSQVPTQRLEGRLLFDNGLPAEAVTLKLYQQSFGGTETLVGEVQTDAQGFYAATYPANGKTTNLDVKAVNDQGDEISLTATKRNARKTEVLNLVAPRKIKTIAPEYARLTEDLRRYLDDPQQLADAQENRDRQDLTLLHQETGWDARLIALATCAAKLTAQTGLSQNVLYAMFRVGLPTDPDQLAQVDGDTVGRAIAKSKEAKIVTLTDQQVAEAQTAFENFARQQRRSALAPGAVSSMGDLLSQSGLTEAEAQTFEALQFAHRGAALWQKVDESTIDSAKIPTLQLQGKLAYLTLNNANLVASLRQDVGSLDNLSQLADGEFYKADTWKTRIRALSNNDDQTLQTLIPTVYAGDAVGDRLDAYAADLARKVRLSFPTRVVKHMIERDELPLAGQQAPIKGAVTQFLQNAELLGFELGKTPIASFVQNNPTVWNGVNNVEAATESVKQLQRLYQITPTDESLKVLMTSGFTSAQDVVAFPVETFIDRFGRLFPSPHEARLVYRKSEQVDTVTRNFLGIVQQLDDAPALYATSPSASVREAAKTELIKQYPTLETLFGSLDFCECEHCRSVLSPAAYLVDLLQFIDPKPLNWQSFLTDWENKHGGAAYPYKTVADQPSDGANIGKTTPYEVLIQRRPDLPNLPLTCENTQVALPYIDIVNEILEYYVIHGKLNADSGHETGTATTPELITEPQNILPVAYKKLQAAQYPLTLPFDLWTETARQFLGHFKLSLAEVLEIFRRGTALFPPETDAASYYRNAVWAESLGLAPAEYALFTQFDAMRWYTLYGYASATEALTLPEDDGGQRQDLNSAKALSRRLGVSYKELVQLVQTGFINPALENLVTLKKLDITVQDVFRYFGQSGYPAFTPEERAAFVARLQALSAEFPTFDIDAWLKQARSDGAFNRILVLADPDTGCNFNLTIFRYADGADADGLAFLKLNLFVRLRRKLGWTIDEVDRALQTFIPADLLPLTGNNIGTAMQTALVYLAHLKEMSDRFNVSKSSRSDWLTLWSYLSTTGEMPLYAQLFLTSSVLKTAPVFDHPFGEYLTDSTVSLADHLSTLQGALNLTADDIERILKTVSQTTATAKLTLSNVSLLYRYGFLAKTLKLSIPELIILKTISGLNPFQPLPSSKLTSLEDDVPFTQTLQFIELVEQIDQTPFAIADLNYLLQHRFDPLSQYQADEQAVLNQVQTLRLNIERILAEQTIPESAASLTQEELEQKLALAFPPDVTETVLGMCLGTIEYEAIQKNTPPADQLDPAIIQDPALQLQYNPVTGVQRLSYRGVLLESKKAQLIADYAPPQLATETAQKFADLLDEVQLQARTFFEKYLEQSPFDQKTRGFLDPADFDTLFSPTSAGLTDAKKEILVQAFFPFLQRQLVQQAITQAWATEFNADLPLIESLVTRSDYLSIPSAAGEPLISAFDAIATAGISANFYPSADGTGTPTQKTLLIADTDITDKPSSSNSARLSGYFEVPTTGAYRFFLALDRQDAEAELELAHLASPLIQGRATTDEAEISEFIELQAETLYPFTLTLRNLGGGNARLLVQSETLPKDSLSQLRLYLQATVDNFRLAYLRLAKSLQLIQGFELSNREVRYLLAHKADFNDFDFNQFPVQTEATLSAVPERLQQLLQLVHYNQLKQQIAGNTDGLIDLFENARRTYADSNFASADDAQTAHLEQLYTKVAELTRRDPAVVGATAQYLEYAAQATDTSGAWQVEAPEFAHLQGLERLWQILQVVEKLGIAIDEITSWTKIIDFDPNKTNEEQLKANEERFAIARRIRDTVKAKYPVESWQTIAQPIFDKLRQQQRDALVAYIMHRRGFDRLEQLFEYFLIDPGMEPVVQTSRIRLAISSLQLFIQRCLLNLEPYVQPTAINSKHWQWMKRYRVWEANRKIFLYPENWLEPEFRDDKTHLFQELESTLLQGNISNDLAEDAFFTYLQKLEVLARLDIVTTYLEENPIDPASNTLHVIGRTYGQPHQYFYRRYAHQMWTPWEPVTAEVEGDHIVAVKWRDRLHLFWVTFLEKTDEDSDNAGNAGEDRLADASFNDVVDATRQFAQKQVEVQLNWSELYQGKWTTRESAGFDNVLRFNVDASFQTKQVFIHVTKDYEAGVEQAIRINLLRPFSFDAAFRVVSKNSAPEAAEWIDYYFSNNTFPYVLKGIESLRITRFTNRKQLEVQFAELLEAVNSDQPTVKRTTQPILQRGRSSYSILMPSNPVELPTPEIAALVSPFFYQDNQHTFFVEPSLSEKTIERWEEWIIPPPKPDRVFDEDWWKNVWVAPREPYIPELIPDPIEPLAKFEVTPQLDWVTNPGTVLQLDETLVGEAGGLTTPGFASDGDRLPGLSPVSNGTVGLGPDVIAAEGIVNVVDSGGLLFGRSESSRPQLNGRDFGSQQLNGRVRDRRAFR